MAKSENNLNAVFQDTANAIREKKQSSAKITPRDFADEVASIQTGIEPTGTKNITENGDNIDVKDYAAVNVNVAGYPEPTGTINITQNGNNINVKDYAAANVNIQPPEPTYLTPSFPLIGSSGDERWANCGIVVFPIEYGNAVDYPYNDDHRAIAIYDQYRELGVDVPANVVDSHGMINLNNIKTLNVYFDYRNVYQDKIYELGLYGGQASFKAKLGTNSNVTPFTHYVETIGLKEQGDWTVTTDPNSIAGPILTAYGDNIIVLPFAIPYGYNFNIYAAYCPNSSGGDFMDLHPTEGAGFEWYCPDGDVDNNFANVTGTLTVMDKTGKIALNMDHVPLMSLHTTAS